MKADNITPIPLIDTYFVIGVLNYLRAQGLDIHEIIEEVGLPEDILTAQHRYVAEVPLKKLFHIIEEKFGMSGFCEFSSTLCQQHIIPNLLPKLSHCRTLREALLAFIDYEKQETTLTKLSLQENMGMFWLVKELWNPEESWSELIEIFSVIYIAELIHLLLRENWHPRFIKLHSNQYQVFEKLPMTVNSQILIGRDVTAVSIRPEFIDRDIKLNAKWELLQGELVGQSFRESIEIALTPYFHVEQLSIERAAEILNVRVRTLQRKFSSEGITYRQLKEGIQMDMAKSMLKNPLLSVTWIATTLGYAHSTHFSRAFNKFVGISPSKYRQQQ